MVTRRSALAGVLGFAGAATARAQESSYFRILTGSTAGAYFPIGGLVASAISGLSSSPSGLVATTINGAGLFEGRPRMGMLRAIANLYPESIHFIARRAPVFDPWPTFAASACRWTSRVPAPWPMRD